MPNMIQQADRRQAVAEEWRYHKAAARVLQAEAWEAFNQAYHADDGEEFREIGRTLYRRVMHEQIQALFLKGDQQNSVIEDLDTAC